jgi:FkbM family methyltransferase
MIPTMAALEATAGGVMKSVPTGLARGEVSAGLYGLGFLGRWALPRLQQRGVRIAACYDANERLNGATVAGLPVRSAKELKTARPEFVIVTARHAVGPVSTMLRDLGLPHVSYDAWHVASDFAAFRGVHDRMLADERSKTVLRAVMMAMLTGDKAHCEAVYEKDQYFCLPRFRGPQREHYVDAGAFVGDSVERFLWSHDGVVAKIYAFEPGARQFAALKTRTARLQAEWALDPDAIELVNAGLGAAGGAMRAASGNGQLTSYAVGAGEGDSVDIVSLDKFLGGRPVSLLKADVEGMEMPLLQGAQATIRRDKPKLAICVYHGPADIAEIPSYLRSLVPQYRFALRHHAPQLMETVLYGWVD